MCIESRIYYPIIKAVLLKNTLYENTGLKLWRRSNLYLDIQLQIKCFNISTLYEVSWGPAGNSPVQSHSHGRNINWYQTSTCWCWSSPAMPSALPAQNATGWEEAEGEGHPQKGGQEVPARCLRVQQTHWSQAPFDSKAEDLMILSIACEELAWQDVHSLGIVKEHCKVLAFVFGLRKYFKIDQRDIKWK